MSYAPRLFGKRHRHDPAMFGIFIHGGSNTQPKWHAHDDATRRYQCNRFSLTIPTRTPSLSDDSPEMIAIRDLKLDLASQPTFRLAVCQARKLRAAFPALAECPIYACTDFMFARDGFHKKGQRPSSGTLAVQLIAPRDHRGQKVARTLRRHSLHAK